MDGDSSVISGLPPSLPPSPQMRCCGVTDYTDWYPVLGENIVPDRCCMENSQGCGRNTTTPLWRTVRLENSASGSRIQEACELEE